MGGSFKCRSISSSKDCNVSLQKCIIFPVQQTL